MSDAYMLRMNALRCRLLAHGAWQKSLRHSLLALADDYDAEAAAAEIAAQPFFAF